VKRDVAYAWRTLLRTPGVTAAAVLSLALGIGANTAIFSLIESTLRRPIAVKGLDRLRLLAWKEVDGGWAAPNVGYFSSSFGSIYEQGVVDGGILHTEFSPAVYHEFLSRSTVFESLFAFKELGRATAVVDGNAEPVNCFLVSGNFFRGLQVSPVIGQSVTPENDVRTARGRVAVISYDYWTRRFGRNPSVLGKSIVLDEIPLTIIGVTSAYFTGIEPGAHFDIWAPLSLAPALTGRPWLDDSRQWQIPMMGRLRPGVSDIRAQTELNALFQSHIDADPGPAASMLQDSAKRPRFLLEPAARGVDYLGPRYDRMMLTLFALASLVLLIACANVANLLLAKAAGRQREISLRLALGAGRARIARQVVTEGLLLAGLAGLTGMLLAFWTRKGIPALLNTPWRPSLFDTSFDTTVLLASLGMTVLTGILFSLAPVWQLQRADLNEALKHSSRSTAPLSKLRLGRLLVVAQAALSVLLLAGAGLCLTTFTNLRSAPLGFNPRGLLLFTVDPPRLRYSENQTVELMSRLQERIGSIAQVRSVSFSRNFRDNSVGTRFFETMGIPIVDGRPLDKYDRQSDPVTAVVNQAFVRRFFAGQNPVGRTYIDRNQTAHRIVGVCADWHSDRLRNAFEPTLYTLLAPTGRALPIDPAVLHGPSSPVTFEVRTLGSESDLVKQIRRAVREVDPNLTVFDVRSARQQIENALSQERLLAALASVFGGLALILAAIGVYGVMAYAVERRVGEIGIRVALGAHPKLVARTVLRETLALVAAGVAVGVPLILAVSPALNHFLAPGWAANFLYGTNPGDPLTIAAAVVVLAGTAMLAGYVPARRAARIDPAIVLRHE
jgi:ABC-type lipoprotein release transport system permease subunit